ncbi:MAG: chemotaxis protein CheB [Thiohalomonadales bacterium]
MVAKNIATKVAVLASSPDQRKQLQMALSQSGFDVVLNEAASKHFIKKILSNDADIVLINVSDSDSEENDAIVDDISAAIEIPILFNDCGPEGRNAFSSDDAWLAKLISKLKEMVNTDDNATPQDLSPVPHPMVSPPSQARSLQGIELPTLSVDTEGLLSSSGAPVSDITQYNVWVLGASLGGPQAVRQFLATIEPDLPVTFILAQHIGANHVALLAEQLDRVTKFKVLPGRTGHKISHQEVILTPADKQLTFTGDGHLSLNPSPPAAIYSPSIDNVMIEVAKIFGERSGTIVFSGMGDDGAKGCQSIAESGGVVWAQDIASCVVSSMPDHARKTGTVTFSAKPEDLARHLYQHYY